MYYNPQWATFKAGTRVRLVRQRKYPEYKLVDLIGRVRTDSSTNVPVIFDDVTNTRSLYGCFYFKAADLVEVDDNNDIMEETNMHNCTNYLNIAKIQFVNETPSSTKTYEYANYEYDLGVGDLCVVKTAHHGLALARVHEIVDRNDLETPREIVAKVYTGDYDTRVEIRSKATELKAQMQARAKQLQDIALYQMLAKDDPEMAQMLSDYQGLPKL